MVASRPTNRGVDDGSTCFTLAYPVVLSFQPFISSSPLPSHVIRHPTTITKSLLSEAIIFYFQLPLHWRDVIELMTNGMCAMCCVVPGYGGYGDGVAIAKAKKGFGGVRC